jgi:hypothetical protein
MIESQLTLKKEPEPIAARIAAERRRLQREIEATRDKLAIGH